MISTRSEFHTNGSITYHLSLDAFENMCLEPLDEVQLVVVELYAQMFCASYR